MSCAVAQYMWYYDLPDPTKRKLHLPAIQKTVIHTVVDILNGILENAETNDNYLYVMISTKFFKKLYGFYKDDEFYNKMKVNFADKNIQQAAKTISILKEAKKLSGKYNEQDLDEYKYPYCLCAKLDRYVKKEIEEDRLYILTNTTNCDNTGNFHNWFVKKDSKENILTCTRCGINVNQINSSKEKENKINNNYKYIQLNNIAKKICITDGSLHLFVYKDDAKICSKCKKNENHEYTKEELNELNKIIMSNKKKIYLEESNEINEIKKIEEKNKLEDEQMIDKIRETYTKNKKNNDFYFIDDFISELYTVMGSDSGHKDIFLKDNAYVIDHDYMGVKLDKPVILTDKDNKISYKANHPFYNTDVIYYSTYKNGKIEIFYDASSKILLGYKEETICLAGFR
jgi:hypothetical protein